ncbi:hypothetical protein U91I_00453 [alpha proteobacterium U9-1i]|nr:hypothetical protein U91I_00453 [alpha proteobacterium U9-1i]
MYVDKLRALLAEPEVDARLMVALINVEREGEPRSGPLKFDHYVEARGRVDEAYEAMRDLDAVIETALQLKLSPGRPAFEKWFEAAITLKNYWADELGRPLTISGHRDDGRPVKVSEFVQFVTECLRQLGAPLDEQSCRTLLLRLRELNWDISRLLPRGVT